MPLIRLRSGDKILVGEKVDVMYLGTRRGGTALISLHCPADEPIRIVDKGGRERPLSPAGHGRPEYDGGPKC